MYSHSQLDHEGVAFVMLRNFIMHQRSVWAYGVFNTMPHCCYESLIFVWIPSPIWRNREYGQLVSGDGIHQSE